MSKTDRLEIRVPPVLIEAIDGWRARQRPLPPRSEAIRRLIEMGLRAEPLLGDVLRYLEAAPEASEPEMAATITALRKALGL